ncbi:peroxiredoxin family protein [Amycolatopsis sp. A133]|uniref:peroxiredoxin family protein n=1 Tax=Amycolatopsis sp. A133 TaxID=3064472 RepID=UPI0027F7F6AC|nr:peroxiredoxin family protein [Amycolatopsis sp. A133]MDQ7803030.1 peroxiredoxin family protein [Amycolatopsis sp. A133]
MLEAGSPAPELVLEDTDGQTVRLADHRGRHAVLLYFMRSTTCPVCRRHVRALAEDAALPAAGVRVLIAVPEDRATAAAWRAKHRIPFPVLTGRRGSPHELVGLSRTVFGALQRSGSILVDVHGVVRHAHGAALPTGSYDSGGIAAAVAALGAPA